MREQVFKQLNDFKEQVLKRINDLKEKNPVEFFVGCLLLLSIIKIYSDYRHNENLTQTGTIHREICFIYPFIRTCWSLYSDL